MYGIQEGEPFQVFVRRQSQNAQLVIRFECKDGMGILGIRKQGRSDPPPSSAYEEEDIDPSSLRAGRFVHVLSTGQRQSYALSRISGDIAQRLPTDSWIELKPQTEYGFRYLVAPDDGASVQATPPPAPPSGPPPAAEPLARTPSRGPVNPPLADAMLARLPKEQAVEYLRAEMQRVQELQLRVDELEAALVKSRNRERDLLALLQRWQDDG